MQENDQTGITQLRAPAHNVNLLKRVPEHDSPTFFLLHRTKCKPMHSEWECSKTINVLHKTVREREKEREGGTERERERERGFRKGVRR